MAILPEYLVDCSVEDVALDADILYKGLMGDQCFCITDICPPQIDLSGAEWAVPFDESLLTTDIRVELEDLTNCNGTGAFDVVTKSIKEILAVEYEKGRITGGDYAHTVTALIEASLANATQFLLQKDIAKWQAKKGLYEAWATRAQVELVKNQISLAQMQQLNQQIEFVNGKMQMMVLKEQYCNHVAQREISVAKQAELSDSQIALYKQQVVSYQRDAEVKAGRIFTDAWITMKTIDEGLTAPNGFTNERIDDVLKKLRDENGFDIIG